MLIFICHLENLEKTECLLTGSFINMYADKQCINGIKIAKNCVKSLGIYLGHDKIQCYEKKMAKQTWKKNNILCEYQYVCWKTQSEHTYKNLIVHMQNI